MKNKEIIAQKQLELVLDGKLGVIRDKNNLPTPEPLMTYRQWQKLGYVVKEGEKATANIEIWQPTVVLHRTAFFSQSQVVRIDSPRKEN